ncbi:unnamed protein product [Sphagnum balticum]
MDYIVQMDNVYSLRRRLNPHHAEDQKKEETRNLRVDQYQRWSHVKNLYAEHRDEMANALDSQDFEKCKAILERIFTMEVDDALRDILEE